MKRLISILLAIVLLTTPVTAQVCDLTKAKTEMTAKTGIFEYKGHWYLYIGGRMQYGKIKFRGNYYYAHKTGSKAYPKGSLTKGQFRIEKGNRWFAYSIDHGKMYVKTITSEKDGSSASSTSQSAKTEPWLMFMTTPQPSGELSGTALRKDDCNETRALVTGTRLRGCSSFPTDGWTHNDDSDQMQMLREDVPTREQ